MIHFVIVGVLVLLSTYGLYNFVLTNEILLPIQASEQAIPIDNLFEIQWFFISFFFSLIVIFLLYSVVVFRRKKGDDGAGEHFEGNTVLEIVWTVVPLIIVLFLALKGSEALAEVERRDPNAYEVTVVASQWNWRFEYPDGETSNTLVLPLDTQILLRMYSNDVIHSFWVPEFRVKQDILPGGGEYIRELRITPNQLGDFKIRCAELCGQLHYSMLADVSVISQDDFDFWIKEQGGGCESDDVTCGKLWVDQNACTACHSLTGEVIVGPSWKGLYGSDVKLNDGSTVVADEEYIRSSILQPDYQVHEGFSGILMPSTFSESLTSEQIDQIIAFIQSLE